MVEISGVKRLYRNTIRPERFLCLFVLAELAFVFVYDRYIGNFQVRGDRIWEIVILIVLLGGGRIALSWRYERNWMSLISAALAPVLMIEVVELWTYIKPIRTIVIVGTIIALMVGFVWTFGEIHYIPCVQVKRRAWFIKGSLLSHILFCIVLIVAFGYIKYLIIFQKPIRFGDVPYTSSPAYNGITDYDNSVAANIETLARIDPEGGWGTLSLDGKVEVLRTYIRVECRYLGMIDSAPSLEIGYLKPGAAAQYDPVRDTITISYIEVVDARTDGYELIRTLCHELFHRYQLYQVRLYERVTSDDQSAIFADLLILRDARVYREEMGSYVTPGKGSEFSFFEYKTQRLEQDADQYGDRSEEDYRKRIAEYLTEQSASLLIDSAGDIGH